MIEIWKDIPGYELYYEVSNTGRVRRKRRTYYNNIGKITLDEKELCPYSNKSGYKYINLQVNKCKVRFPVHKLVALAFIPNPNNYLIINHKDENKINNNVDNLEWCDTSYNLSYGHRAEKMFKTRIDRHRKTAQRKVIQFDLQDNIIAEYNSISEADRATSISCGSIWQSCNKGTITNNMYKWKYKQ